MTIILGHMFKSIQHANDASSHKKSNTVLSAVCLAVVAPCKFVFQNNNIGFRLLNSYERLDI